MADGLWTLFDRGGSLLWVILALSCLLWTLILERLDFLRRLWPRLHCRILQNWRPPMKPAVAERKRQAVLLQAEVRLAAPLVLIDALTQALPLLGLLGTVTGMIKVFDVLTVFGTANARAMAAGISEALITTLAGLVTALSGLWLASYLRQRARAERDRLALELSGED
ncbi:biopolymer transport protein ExbB [Methylomarinovum caldicuralii]|uniref:Biopolymer transport protein ExbB n=1 Tax=Methylomarinovum caldicuralii TaxID=438856 RepID=A0AAU9C9R4_9GAMM|nr:MotA/TolQ/ExbB proton channel family protein [Methylomarinovum caldicuralii]BCX81229.1 biopolymer transport protein ExbB [Methylomarinovum caldicuralii]